MTTVFKALPNGTFLGPNIKFKCALGRGGMIAANEKNEGVGASPIGVWPLRRIFYRKDKITPPTTELPLVPIREHDGWCDDPSDPLYNRPISIPYSASHEKMWRDDDVYDIVVELGHNDDPPVPGLGSAIFLHLARENYRSTEGCIALSETDLRAMLKLAGKDAALEICGPN